MVTAALPPVRKGLWFLGFLLIRSKYGFSNGACFLYSKQMYLSMVVEIDFYLRKVSFWSSYLCLHVNLPSPWALENWLENITRAKKQVVRKSHFLYRSTKPSSLVQVFRWLMVQEEKGHGGISGFCASYLVAIQ